MLRQTIRVVDRLVSRAVAILCLLLFLICLYATVDAANVYLHATSTAALKYKPKLDEGGGEVLRQIAEDAVAWLSIEDTRIDYPVMQGETNETYLNTDPFGNFSLAGSIFLDCRNSPDFSDDFSLIYGHHMEYGAMFGALDAFYEPDFFRQHRAGTLATADGKTYSVRFFACCKAMANESLIFDPENGVNRELLRYLERSAAIYEPVPPESRIVALSTCQGADSIERLLLFGTLRELTLESGAR